MKHGNEIQANLQRGQLYQAVCTAADAIRDSVDYDLMTVEQRRLALVCAILEQVAQPEQIAEVIERLQPMGGR